jgi:hypothetical protein
MFLTVIVTLMKQNILQKDNSRSSNKNLPFMNTKVIILFTVAHWLTTDESKQKSYKIPLKYTYFMSFNKPTYWQH